MQLTSVRKPPTVVETCYAEFTVFPGDKVKSSVEILDAGLTALGETRDSLFNYGVERWSDFLGSWGRVDPARSVSPGFYRVFGERD